MPHDGSITTSSGRLLQRTSSSSSDKGNGSTKQQLQSPSVKRSEQVDLCAIKSDFRRSVEVSLYKFHASPKQTYKTTLNDEHYQEFILCRGKSCDLATVLR